MVSTTEIINAEKISSITDELMAPHPLLFQFLEAAKVPLVLYKTVIEGNVLADLKIIYFNKPYLELSAGRAKIGSSINYLPEKAAKYWVPIFQEVYSKRKAVIIERCAGSIRQDVAGAAYLFPLQNVSAIGFVLIPETKTVVNIQLPNYLVKKAESLGIDVSETIEKHFRLLESVFP
jgi:hypothetical protein